MSQFLTNWYFLSDGCTLVPRCVQLMEVWMVWYGMVMSMTDTWRPKRPGPASDRDSATRQTLRAGIRVPVTLHSLQFS